MLGEAGLVERSRIVMEKPFGTDLASAVSLNAKLHEVFQESQIFRIDHFLGKEPAQNILAFPFRQRIVRADLESQFHRPHSDRRAGDVRRSIGARRSTKPPARTATWW